MVTETLRQTSIRKPEWREYWKESHAHQLAKVEREPGIMGCEGMTMSFSSNYRRKIVDPGNLR
jgi:hypothetical protein